MPALLISNPEPLAVPTFDNNLVVPDPGHFRLRGSDFVFGRPRDLIADPKLCGGQRQRTHERLVVSQGAGVHHASQMTPHDDVAACDNFCPWIYVSDDDD